MSNPSKAARAAILARLRAAPKTTAPDLPPWQPPSYPATERLDRFVRLIEAAHADVVQTTASDWPQQLAVVMQAQGLDSLLYAPTTKAGQQLAAVWAKLPQAPQLIPYDRPVEQLKDTLVHGVAAGLTTTLGAIAETGSLVLWPTPAEPRLMSLLPPVHVALVQAEAITDFLAGLMQAQNWAASMPTNAVLVSGPSKTADIEQTLAYGVHGPKGLIVLVIA